MSIFELTPLEIYNTYVEGEDPAALIEEGRSDLASRLRLESGLGEKEAHYAADQILARAQSMVDGQG